MHSSDGTEPEPKTEESTRKSRDSHAEIEKRFKYSHTFNPREEKRSANERDSPYSGLVSELIEEILRTSTAGQEFAESSLSIRNATK